MKKVSYTVVLTEQAGSPFPIKLSVESSEAAAVTIAKKWAGENPDKLVFIEYFRKRDGQGGYINPDGFNITGVSWTD